MARSVLSRIAPWLREKLAPLDLWYREAVSKHKQGLVAQLSAPATGAAVKETLSFKELGWGRKILGAAFLYYLGSNAFPIVSEGTLKHGVLLLQRRDPFFKRTGASRVVTFAITDKRRQQVVEMGGIDWLVDMLQTARDDKTLLAALKSISSLSQCDAVVEALDDLGARAVLREIAASNTNPRVLSLVSTIQGRLRQIREDEDETASRLGEVMLA